MSDVNLKLVIAVARSYNTIFSKIEKQLQEEGLNISEFGVLEMLLNKGEQPVQKIAEKILVTSGTITYVVNKLEKKELVYRRNCEKDKRIYYIDLTPKGRELITEVFEKHKFFIENMFSNIDFNKKAEIVSDLVKLQNSVK